MAQLRVSQYRVIIDKLLLIAIGQENDYPSWTLLNHARLNKYTSYPPIDMILFVALVPHEEIISSEFGNLFSQLQKHWIQGLSPSPLWKNIKVK